MFIHWIYKSRMGKNFAGLLCENMTSYTKPEVHNMLHYRPRRTDPRPRVTCRKFRVFDVRILKHASGRTDIQARWSQYFQFSQFSVLANAAGRNSKSVYCVFHIRWSVTSRNGKWKQFYRCRDLRLRSVFRQNSSAAGVIWVGFVKAKFHYASLFGAGSELVRSWFGSS